MRLNTVITVPYCIGNRCGGFKQMEQSLSFAFKVTGFGASITHQESKLGDMLNHAWQILILNDP